MLRRAIAKAGELSGRDSATWNAAVAAAVDEAVAQSEQAVAVRVAEEATLVAGMLATRSAAFATAVVDDPRAERVPRQEAHLSYELDRALTHLERLRGMRPPKVVPGPDGVPVGIGA